MEIKCFKDFAEQASRIEKRTIVAVVEAHDEHTLESVITATNDGIIFPQLIGSAEKIKELLKKQETDPSKYEIISAAGIEESLKIAVRNVNSGDATAIMKGRLDTSEFMRAVVNRENGLLVGAKLSLIGFFETPNYHKLLAVSDIGLNTYPDLESKKAIVENAVKMLNAVGINKPKVAVLAAVENMNPKMPDTVDGDALKKMNVSGEIGNCVVEGPISFDLATSAEAAKIKEFDSPVAGDADLLIVPDICAGNILAKCLTGFCGAHTAGTVLGAKAPVILTSRSAHASDKYYSIALAAYAAAKY